MPPKGAPWETFFSPRYTDGWMEWCVCLGKRGEQLVNTCVSIKVRAHAHPNVKTYPCHTARQRTSRCPK